MANKRLDESLGTVGYDNLFVENVPEADVVAVKLAASQGVLARGTVVSGTPGGEDFAALAAAAEATKAIYVLADEVDTGTSGAVVGIAYRTGHFNRAALAVKTEYTLTAADEEILRGKGILVSDALEY
ncbi:Uncharacterised protein [uncultured Flavonifractor sp.]|nr:Uncharacterised protein [uncultured Flavonifractor sp.]